MLPASLEVLVQEKVLKPEEIVNGADAQHRKFVYRPRAGDIRKIANWGETPLVWEEPEGDHVAVGFADGHSEYMTRDAAEAAIRKAEEAVKGK